MDEILVIFYVSFNNIYFIFHTEIGLGQSHQIEYLLDYLFDNFQQPLEGAICSCHNNKEKSAKIIFLFLIACQRS